MGSIPGQGAKIPHASWPKSQNIKQKKYCNKFNKGLKMIHHRKILKNVTFESVLMRWMELEPIIQSEVSQKEKHQYSILTHIYGI